MTPFVHTPSTAFHGPPVSLSQGTNWEHHQCIMPLTCIWKLVPQPEVHCPLPQRSLTTLASTSGRATSLTPDRPPLPEVPSPAFSTGSFGRQPSPTCLIDLETLANFETVTDQFSEQGIQFENAIALQPSNPAFPEFGRGIIALIGAPKQGFINTTFTRPIRQIEACVTSSRPLAMTAFDEHNQILAQTGTVGSNLVSQSHSTHSLLARLVLRADSATIHQVLFRCTGGNFTLSDLKFQR